MSDDSRREVVFVLTTEMSAAVGADLQSLVQQAKAAQGEIGKAAKQQAQELAKLSKEQAAEKQRQVKEQTLWEQEQYKTSVAANKQAARDQAAEAKRASDEIKRGILEREAALKASAKEQAALLEQQRKDATAAAKQVAREEAAAAKQASAALKQELQERAAAQRAIFRQQQEQEREAARTTEQLTRARATMATSTNAVISGTMESARGVALLVAGADKSIEKLVKSLVVIEGAYSSMVGASRIVQSLTRAWEAYQVQVAAAARATGGVNALLGMGGAAGGAAGAAGGAFGRLGGVLGGGLAKLGGGSLGTGAAIIGAPVAAAAGVYAYAAGAANWERDLTLQREQILSDAFGGKRQQAATSMGDEQQVLAMEQQRRIGARGLETDAAERAAQSASRWQTAKQPILSRTWWNWSAEINPYRPSREPGAAGYENVESQLAADRQRGQGALTAYEGEAGKASQEVAQRKRELAAAQAKIEETRKTAALASSSAAGAQQDVQSYDSRWIYGTNWLRSGANWAVGSTERGDLQRRAEGAGTFAGVKAREQGQAEAAGQDASKALEEAQKREQEGLQKIAAQKQLMAQRDIQYSEEYLGKLKEQYQAHMANAVAIERSGQALSSQLATDPSTRAKLTSAMQRAKDGTATDRQLALLAQNASPAKSKQFLDQIEKRHPEYEGLKDFLGKGKAAVDEQKGMAADEEKRIKETESHIQEVKEGAAQAADKMSEKLAGLLKELFTTQESRFVRAIELLRQDIEIKGVSDMGASQR